MKTWLKRISAILIVLMIGNWVLQEAYVGTDLCVICSHLKCHAPCILNLATGEISELDLYQPHATLVGEIAEEQYGGTFSFIRPVGLQGTRTTDPWHLELDVPIYGNRKCISMFCWKCRKILAEYMQGYVLLDIYNPQVPCVCEIDDEAIYVIRCYRISMSRHEEDKIKLCINGTR